MLLHVSCNFSWQIVMMRCCAIGDWWKTILWFVILGQSIHLLVFLFTLGRFVGDLAVVLTDRVSVPLFFNTSIYNLSTNPSIHPSIPDIHPPIHPSTLTPDRSIHDRQYICNLRKPAIVHCGLFMLVSQAGH